jgi:hypothetical protein
MIGKICCGAVLLLLSLSPSHAAYDDQPSVTGIDYKCTNDPEHTSWAHSYKNALLAVTPSQAVAAADRLCQSQFKGDATEVQITFSDGTKTTPATPPGAR